MDYFDSIGVPITFLHKYNPNQFEILKFRKGNDDKDLSVKGKSLYLESLSGGKNENSTKRDYY
jgi:hypothetical protein